jgi:NOL1/NOP2/fmu family ribosome biogenesis protein
LKPDGILVYSTCSYSKEEDEDIMDFLMDHALLEPIDIDVPESWGIVKTYGSKGGCGYRFFPGKASGEGFFITCFRIKQSVPGEGDHGKKKTTRNVKTSVPANWLRQDVDLETILAGEEIYCIPRELLSDHISLREVLNVRKSGVKAGSMGRHEFIPDHELVLSYLVSGEAPGIALDKTMALQYLRKQLFDPGAASKGWYVVSYDGLALGLVKHLGNRLNNYYPASWRILMS